MYDYSSFTTVRLLHCWHHKPTWIDREGVGRELERRGVPIARQPSPDWEELIEDVAEFQQTFGGNNFWGRDAT
jgi:hypothetical protein